MNTTEEKLKAYILTKYKSLRDFVNNSDVGIPYTTIDGMLKRGLHKANISNVVKLCQTLGISADELSDGNIVPVSTEAPEQIYAKKLSELTPENFKSATTYIDYLLKTQKESPAG